MEACGNDSRYVRPVDERLRSIGSGGSSDSIERWYDTQRHMPVAAKSMVNNTFVARREDLAMQRAADHAVPRVVNLVEQVDISPQQTYVVMELVHGITISSYVAEQMNATPTATSEDRMLTVAVQVFDTLHALHNRAGMAHLDLTSSNIMLSHNDGNPWGRVRLIDLGSSRLCTAGKKDVLPNTISPDYAATEIALSCIDQTNETFGKQRVNGPAADVWSSAVVLYLTGQLPFDFKELANAKLPAGGRTEGGSADLMTLSLSHSVAAEHFDWIKAVMEAKEQGTIPQHPLIQRIRQHSATPELAVDFFAKLFHPRPEQRPTAAEALGHPYLKSCAQEMQDYFSSCKNSDGMVQPQDSAADLSCIRNTRTAKEISLAQSEGDDATALHPCKPHRLRRLSSAAGRRLHLPQGLRLVKRSVGTVLRPLACLHHHIHFQHCDAPAAAPSQPPAPPSDSSSNRSAGAANADTTGATAGALTSSLGPTSPSVPLSAYFPKYKHEPSLTAQAPTVVSLTASSGSQLNKTAMPACAMPPAETSLEQGVQLPASAETEVPSLPQLCSERSPAQQSHSSAGRSCHPPDSRHDASTKVDRQAVGADNTSQSHRSSRRKRRGWLGKVGKGLAVVGTVVGGAVGASLILAASRR